MAAMAFMIISALLCAALLTGVADGFSRHCPLATGACKPELVGYQFNDRKNTGYGKYVVVTADGNNLTEAGFDWNKPVAVIIHGFEEATHRSEISDLKHELLKNSDMSVLIMDWSKISNICYVTAVVNARYAGKCLAELVNTLGRPSTGLHVIGMSLGCYVPGLAADYLAPYKIPRITALDPAFPMFWGLISQRKLKKDDGEFVDVIHTNAFVLGHFLPMGHVDFFINGAIFQPGCSGNILDVMACSHLRSFLYYTESISSDVGFWGCKTSHLSAFHTICSPEDISILMGYHVDKNLRGIVMLTTKSESPFANGKYAVNKTLALSADNID